MRNQETQESIAKCRRCRRVLRSLSSRLAGIGPRCAKPCYHAGAARLLACPAIRRVLRRATFTKAA